MHQLDTAILLFSRTACEEAAHKKLSHQLGRKANVSMANVLIQHSLRSSKKSGLPVFECYSSEQSGTSFGIRLANAIESVYAQGYQRVIAIGNDTPDLTPELLTHTENELVQTPLILGPSDDGGVYLIGMDWDAYDRDTFIDLPWESSMLVDSWQNYAQEQSTTINWLQQLHDIDLAEDLNWFLKHRIQHSLWKVIGSFMASFCMLRPNVSLQLQGSNLQLSFLLRAPPL